MTKFILIYFIVINLIAVIFTVYDKIAAIHSKRRIRERTLFIVAVLGGAPLMYLTMLIIRHKTRHTLFMIGIPVIFILELLVFIIFSLVRNG